MLDRFMVTVDPWREEPQHIPGPPLGKRRETITSRMLSGRTRYCLYKAQQSVENTPLRVQMGLQHSEVETLDF